MPGNDRAALVTGSTSGLGLAIVLRLARSGYRVTLSYSSDDQQAERAPHPGPRSQPVRGAA